MPVELRGALDNQRDLAARIRELNRVAENVHENLFKLGVVADVIFSDVALVFANVFQIFVAALFANERVNLIDKRRERKFFVAKTHATTFNAAHVEYVVDD